MRFGTGKPERDTVGEYHAAQEQYRAKLRELIRHRTDEGDPELQRRELLTRRYATRESNSHNTDQARMTGRRFVIDIPFDYDRKRAVSKAPGEALERLTDSLLENYEPKTLERLSRELKAAVRGSSIELDGDPESYAFRWSAKPNREELSAMAEELHSVLGDTLVGELQESLDASIATEEELASSGGSPMTRALLGLDQE